MEVKKRNIVILSLSLVMICTVTFCAKFVKYIDITALKVIVYIFLNLSNGLIALIAMKLTNMKINIAPKNKRQYLIGAAIALVLNVVIAIVPAFCGFSLIGNHMDFSWTVLTYDFLFYMLIIGPVEEFVFREYLQDAFMNFFEKNKWLAVVIQVIFTFGIGLVFGFAKYKIKDCGYMGVVFAHGLYDFLNTVVRKFIV
ncbi:CPBP family glutamic-type intramembrane protease [Ruminococcus bicirculans (ex Wegman et al. 2014)]|uniref:CPBP family glutamic-type intramembrane protease n=1 Tax=Ruminococcus bicirculans (ex Wegman et al. 2014) TaxID=1160721 RepID=UPI003FD8F948